MKADHWNRPPTMERAWLYRHEREWEEIVDPLYGTDEDDDDLLHLGYEPQPERFGIMPSHAIEVFYPLPSSSTYRILLYASGHFLATIYVEDFLAYLEIMPQLLGLVQRSLQLSSLLKRKQTLQRDESKEQ